ncbi:Uncharacterized protein BP5553_04047 [Venustampulla echinocandica]|uniref:SRP9 domain-containing protein n=1 Tax=Venustampulla echinocandica TaxID=2656787 RepID=A0A370TW00_9HELO|nr:Uncharacterized protein BP5553_04047 [Venustampulla echinocandica]RDL39707.1 Uncharacterized protein BP5553_04047 [Venustampulla echinocandica]
MPTLESAQSWLTQSTLLLQARPLTTRITTKYSLPRQTKSKSTQPPSSKTSSEAAPPAPSPTPVATLTLKTFDPVSGTTLKYKTDKAAEVGRLVQIMGRLARPMAGLPEVKEDAVMGEGGEGAAASGVATPTVEAEKVPAAGQGGKVIAGGGTGGKKGKKKGKK